MKTLLAVVLWCLPMAAQAMDTAGSTADAAKEKKICRSEEVTGSIFTKRVCHTKAEWVALEAERERGAAALRNRRDGNGSDIPR